MLQSNLKTIIILPLNHHLIVEVQSTATVFELFQKILQHLKLEGSFKQWTCYSVSRQKQLNILEKIGNYQNEIFNVHIKSDLESQNEKIEDINIQIDIYDSGANYNFRIKFKSNDILQLVEQVVLKYCQIEHFKDVATVDLFIFNQPYYNQIKKFQTFSELNIKNNTTIIAKIRWQGA